MTLREIEELLRKTGLPVEYRAFPEKQAPPLPYICYLVLENNNFAADGKVYFSTKNIRVELYTQFKNEEMERKVEEVLSSFYFQKEEIYIEKEKCYQIIYELEI